MTAFPQLAPPQNTNWVSR